MTRRSLGNLDGASEGIGGTDSVRIKPGTGDFVGAPNQDNPDTSLERARVNKPEIIIKEGPVGPRGEKGDKGDRGEPGEPGEVDPLLLEQLVAEEVARALNVKRLQFKDPAPVEVFGTKSVDFLVELYDVIQATAEAVAPQFTLSTTEAGTIDANGKFTAKDITHNASITVTATYTANDVEYTTSTPLLVRALIPSSLTVSGSITITSGTVSTYAATVRYTDNSTQLVTAHVDTTWSITNNALGTLSANSLSAAYVSAQTSGKIQASYSENGVTVYGSLDVTVVPEVIRPYFGVASLPANIATMTQGDWINFITALPYRGPNGNRLVPDISLCQAPGQYLWYAAPTSYGNPLFYDKDSGFTGGWDGAKLPFEGVDPTITGPRIVNITINGIVVEFGLYRTDYSGLGCPPENQWAVQ